MELLLKRIAKRDTYTIGRLYIDGKYICDTCEDKDRGLTNKMTDAEVRKIKVNTKTAIPTGTYLIVMNMKSPRFSKRQYYYNYCKGYLPRLLNVPGFDGILIHIGNTAEHSAGCILVGKNTQVGKVLNSKKTFEVVYPMLKAASDRGEAITITIQ